MGGPLQVCPECHGRELYRRRGVPSGATVAASPWAVTLTGREHVELLPGLGTLTSFPTFDVVVCGQCGLTRLYAEVAACQRLPGADGWERLSDT